MYRIAIILLLLPLLFATINLIAQPNIEWQKTFGGSSDDRAYDVEQTTDGGFIIAGESRSVDGDLDGGNGWKDYWVVKLANDGTLEWENRYGGTNHDIAEDIVQTSDGGYIVAGRSDSSNGDVTDHRGLTDFWVVKISHNGTLEWEKSLGGNNNDFAYAIEQTQDGGYIVGGVSNSTNGDVTGNHGNYDFWAVKLTSTGSIEWEKSLGGSKIDYIYSLAQTAEGGYILAGKSTSSDGDVTGSHGGGLFVNDAWVVKLSTSGEIEWEKALGGTDNETAYSVRQTDDGSYIVSGFAASSDGDVTGNHGDWDYWIVKLSENGDLLWQKSLGGSNDEIAHSIRQTTDSGFITFGYSKSTWGDVTGNHGDMDFWVVKLTTTGDIDWQKSLGGTGTDRGFSVKQTNDEGYILAGRTNSNNGDVTGQHGENDFWVVKLGPCGVNTELEIEDHTLVSSEVALSSTYQWINCHDDSPIVGAESSSFAPETGGDYAVIVTNGSCVDTSACVNICPLSTDVIAFDNTIQSTEDSPNATFQWIDCSSGAVLDGEVNPLFEPSLNGEYAVVITEENCSVTSECITACPEGINEEIVEVAGTLQALADTFLYDFQWIDCNDNSAIDGQTGSQFTPTNSGDYAVIISEGSCFTTSDCMRVCLIDTHVWDVDSTLISSEGAPLSVYQWIDCSTGTPIEGQTEPSFTPTVNGQYAVIISQANCVDTSDCINVSIITGLEEPINPTLKVYPNPIQGFIMLETGVEVLGANYMVYDNSGREVASGIISSISTRLSLSGLPNGIYTLKIESEEEVITARFVKSS